MQHTEETKESKSVNKYNEREREREKAKQITLRKMPQNLQH